MRTRLPLAAALAAALATLAGCSSSSKPPACSYTYSDWAACTAGTPQSRTVLTTAPAGCTGTPELTRACPDYLLHVASPAWRDQVIYFVMTDRFADGDPSNDDQHRGEFDRASAAKYSGGDLQGIIDHLDYIQALGATAVWITPPVANMWWDPLQQYGGYHGYWARDLSKVDEHLGTLDTYQRLSDALHRRGMYLIQDVVPNHMQNSFTWSSYPAACTPATDVAACTTGPAIPGCDVTQGFVLNTQAAPSSKPQQAPFDQVDATDPAQRAAAIYHWTPAISDYQNACQEVDYQTSDLDDLDTENPVVRAALKRAYGAWIQRVGVDAFRVDTVKYVPHEFWNDFFHSTDAAAPGILAQAAATGRSGFLAFGEVYETSDPGQDTADRRVASYLGTPGAPELPSVLEFPLFAELGRVFGAPAAPTTDLTYRVNRLLDPTLFPDPTIIPTFVDNHDVPRFLANGSPAGLAQALAFLFTSPGIPVVYYGTEQGFTESRAAMFAGGFDSTADHFDTTRPEYQRLRALAALRKAHPIFSQGAMQVRYDNPAGAGPFAYARTLGGETALVLLNTSESRMLVSGLATGLPGGAALEVLYQEGWTTAPAAPAVAADGTLMATLPARAILVLRATGATVTPPTPAATITIDTPIQGQVFTGDVTITGRVSPVTARVALVLDGYVDRITMPTVQADGTFSILLRVSGFDVGRQDHTLAFYDATDQVATPTWRFTSDVVFAPVITDFADPAGDDTGPTGSYLYPGDPTYAGLHLNDLTNLEVQAAATTMKLVFTLADFSTVWKPQDGFDHVAFSIFFELPGKTGATVLPLLSASAPPGFTWKLNQTSYGWSTLMHTDAGATDAASGALARAPRVSADPIAKTVTFTYSRSDYGLASWSGVRIYATTWDIDGLGGGFRPLVGPPATPGVNTQEWSYAGGALPLGADGQSAGPKIMDAIGPVAIP